MVPAFIGQLLAPILPLIFPMIHLQSYWVSMIFMLGIVLLKPKRWLIETVSAKTTSHLNYRCFTIGWYAGFIQMGGCFIFSSPVLVSKHSLTHANMIKIMISFAILFPALLIYIYNNQVDWEPAIVLALGQD